MLFFLNINLINLNLYQELELNSQFFYSELSYSNIKNLIPDFEVRPT